MVKCTTKYKIHTYLFTKEYPILILKQTIVKIAVLKILAKRIH